MVNNILIIEDNLQYLKEMLNYVISKLKNVQLSFIATSIEEAIDIINSNHIDLVFLDLKLSVSEEINVIEKIRILNGIREPDIIIISTNIALKDRIKKLYCNVNVIERMSSYECIYKEISRIIYKVNYSQQEDKMKSKVMSELVLLGYDFKYKGTIYIFEAINFIYRNNSFDLLDNLEGNVYNYIALKYHKSVNNIKTNIIKATNIAWIYQDKSATKTYLALKIKPTPKIIISTILTKCRYIM